MERFNLKTWLEDKSRKIVTRDGKQARIICYDVKQGKQDDCDAPIIALIDKGEEIGEMSYYYSEDGSFLRNSNQTHNLDLFFAEEGKLNSIIDELKSYLEKTPKEQVEKDWKEIQNWYIQHFTNEKENSEFKPKFTYNEKDYSELANKLIEFRNNTPLCSVSYRDGEGRKAILHYEKEILDLARNVTYNPYKATVESIAEMVKKYEPYCKFDIDSHLNDFINNVKVKCKDAMEYDKLFPQEEFIPKKQYDEDLNKAYKNADKVQFNRGMDEILNNPQKYFHVGDTIRLKKSKAEYTITSIFNGQYHGKGWYLDAQEATKNYELVNPQKKQDKKND